MGALLQQIFEKSDTKIANILFERAKEELERESVLEGRDLKDVIRREFFGSFETIKEVRKEMERLKKELMNEVAEENCNAQETRDVFHAVVESAAQDQVVNLLMDEDQNQSPQ